MVGILHHFALFAPLIGFIFASLSAFKGNTSRNIGSYFSLFCIAIAALSSSFETFLYGFSAASNVTLSLMEFIAIGGKNISSWSIEINSVSAMMASMVCLVSLVVHLYSMEYMQKEKNRARFMSYISLFTFFMLLLVFASDLLQFFVGWEGVGFCSYLLIGYWTNKNSATTASYKAFVVNRIGDAFFLVAIFLIYSTFGSIKFGELTINTNIEIQTLTTIGLLLLAGAFTKSAQIGFHIWLPDAMEGPTPVSALIHAATMVTAGIMLIIKTNAIFTATPNLGELMAIIGAITASTAAIIACKQYDIKKIIAYSTCSQLGLMFVALGTSSYSVAMLHLLTHAFFKALLFLCAGAIIHSLHGEQDIRNISGLAKKMPYIFVCMIIGTMAITGSFPFSGYYSKEAILAANYSYTKLHTSFISLFTFILTILSAIIGTFYSFRLLFTLFLNKNCENQIHLPHISIKSSLAILVVPSLISGWVMTKYLKLTEIDGNVMSDVVKNIPANQIMQQIHHTPIAMEVIVTLANALIMILCYFLYGKNRDFIENQSTNKIQKAIESKLYFDEFFHYTLVKPTKKLSNFFGIFDAQKLTASFLKIGNLSIISSGKISIIFNGSITRYIAIFLAGSCALIVFFLYYQ